jgi:hypothetical protein
VKVSAVFPGAEVEDSNVTEASNLDGALNIMPALDRPKATLSPKDKHRGSFGSGGSDESKDSSEDGLSSESVRSGHSADLAVRVRSTIRKSPQKISALRASSAEDGAKSDSAGRSDAPGSPRSARAESLSAFSAVPSMDLDSVRAPGVAVLDNGASRKRLYSVDSSDRSPSLSDESADLQSRAPVPAPAAAQVLVSTEALARQRADTSDVSVSVHYSVSLTASSAPASSTGESSSGEEWTDDEDEV